MIKQSRNAVTMLLSCFKGIYQSAYVKGIASAVVLTAGLAAGAANADNITGAANGSEWVISSTATVDETTGITNIPETVTTVKVTGAGAVTVSPSSSTAYAVDRNKYDLVVEKGAAYTVSGSASAAATENWNNITVTGGTVTIGGAGTNASVLGTTDEGEGNIILNSADTTVAKVVLNGTGSTATLGTANKSAITLDGNAQIEIKGTNSGSVAGASFTMEETLTTKASATPSVSVVDNAKGAISVKNFTMEGGYIKNLGTLSIGATGGTATITGGTIENGTAAADVITFTSAVTLANGVNVVNNSGALIKFDDDATVDGSLFTNGKLWKDTNTAGLTLASGKTLTVDSEPAVDLVTSGFVKADGTIAVATAGGATTVALDKAVLNTSAFAGGNIGLKVGELTVSGNAGDFTIGNATSGGTITVLDSLNMTSTTADTAKTKTVNVGNGTQIGTLTLGESGSVADGSLNGINLVVAAGATSAINVAGGNWTGNDVTVTAGKFNVNGGSFTGDTLDVTATASAASVADGASATFDTVKVQKASGMTVNGTLTVMGDGDPLKDPSKPYDETSNPYTTTVDLTTSADNSLTIADGGNVIIGDAKDVLQLKYASNAFSTGGDYKKLTNNGTLTLKGMDAVLDGVSALNKTQLDSLKGALQATGSTGKIDIGSVNIDFSDVKPNENGEYTYSNVSFASGFVNDQTQDMKISVTSAENTSGLAGNWASFNTTDSTINTFNLNGSTTLYGDEKGNLAVKHTADGDEILGFNFAADTSLTLEGSGKIGAISATTAGHGTVVVENDIQVTNAKGDALAAIGASKEVKEVIVNGSLQASGINAYELTVNGGTLDMATESGAQNIVLGFNSSANAATKSVIDGGYVTADGLELKAGQNTTNTNDLEIYGGSTVVVDTFTAAGNTNIIRVGRDADEDDGIASSTGSFYAGTLTLAGATLEIDPEYSNQAAVVAADKLSTGSTVDGMYELGKNAALGVGFESLDEFRTEALSKFTNANGALDKDNIGSLVYLNKGITLGVGNGIALNAEKTPTAAANTVDLGANTALVVSRSAFFTGDAYGNTPSDVAALTAGNGSAATQVNLDVNSKIILDGIFTAADTGMNLITANAGQAVNVQLKDGTANAVTGSKVEVQVGNGVITAGSLTTSTIAAGNSQALTFAINDDKLNALNASSAAKELVRDSFEDYSAEDIDENAGLSFVYLAGTGYVQDGSAIDAAANLAVFGGAAQTALMASQTTTDVISARMGVGNVNSALMYADNANGAGIWLAPVYRNHDSDSFDANGVDYGADIDLTGVAFGADFTTDEGLRFGAMFNIGTGDADGQGAASAVSNDFDYYALGLYAGASFDKFSLVGDLTYAQSSNDIGMNSIIGKMDADTDVSALSFGLTGQYEFTTEVLDILPHVGVRFTQLEMDSYDVKVGGDAVAASDSDTMNIVSIPVGVTFAKEIAAGEWYVKPALDLAVTMNTGDNELDTDTSFGSLSMEPVSAEVIDDVTYSVGLGLSARYNALSLGLGVNYVGSDNTDELGVNGMARYSF